jgi:rieske iron-sulfur protein
VLKAGLGLGSLVLLEPALAQDGTVAAGDVLVYASGDQADKPIQITDLTLGKFFNAYPKDQSGNIKKSLNTMIALVRLDPKTLDPATAKNAVEGVVAYSAVCTHQGCPIDRIGEVGTRKGKLICNCHGSVFEPTAGAKVLGGQAKRPLASLPLKLEGKQLVAAGGFIGKVG